MASSATAAAPSAGSSREQWLALLAIILGAFVAILNNSLINVAIPKLTTDLGSTTSRIQWVLTGYMLASGVIIPITGYMEERIGYKKFLLLALAIFTGGTVLCAVAWSDTSLIMARVIAGIGGGVIGPLSMVIIYKIMPREQIGTALGLWGVSAMVAPAVGPTLSGYLIEWFNWRFLFIICIPFALFAMMMVSILLKEPAKTEPKPFDFAGFLLAATSAGTLLYALSNGQSKGWTSFEIVALLFISFWALIFLLFVEKQVENPVIELSLFKNFVFVLSIIVSSLVMVGLYGAMFLMPIYLQNIQGVSPIDTGLLLMPQAICMAFMMPVAGKLFDKVGVIPLGLTGLSLMGVTTYELHRLTADTPHEWLIPLLMVRGIGIGLCMMPFSTAGMNAVAPHLVGKASAASNLIRQVAASMAIAVFTVIMQQRTAIHLQSMTDSIPFSSAQSVQGLLGTSWSTTLAGLMQREATTMGIVDTFVVSAIPLFICLPLVFLFRKKKVRQETNASES
ncbi:EmrB/QacA subfamily drug resistance transporter [Bacillus fengqiuensis]|nr:EmrB/QacA subfamily drug resistance transporter [Bacillus fengqiuensis]